MADTDTVPGFIALPSRTEDGRVSLSVSHITLVGPTRRARDTGAQECTITMEGGYSIVALLRRPEVLLLIAESIGAVPVGTGEQLDALLTRAQSNTRRLRRALADLRGAADQVTEIQDRERARLDRVTATVDNNTQRLAKVLGQSPTG